MRIRNYILTLTFIAIFTSEHSLDSWIFRRIRALTRPGGPHLAQPVSPELVHILSEAIPAIGGLLIDANRLIDADTEYKYSKDTWRVGLILAMLKDIKELELQDLDIDSWIKENYAVLQRYFKDLEIPTSSQPFERLRDVHKEKAYFSYWGILDSMFNWYFLVFLSLADPSIGTWPEEREARHRKLFEEILDMPLLTKSPSEKRKPFIPEDYFPDLYTLGDIPSALRRKGIGEEWYRALKEKEIEEYLLNRLLEFELRGYAECLLGKRKRRERGLEDDEEFLKIFLPELETDASKAFIKRFVEENKPILRRILKAIFYFKPYFAEDKPLIDQLTIAEAECLVRRVLRVYFKNAEELKGSPALTDPHYYLNESKNRYAYAAWELVLEGIQKIKGRYEKPDTTKECQKEIIRYLLKILAISGVFDFSIAAIRERVSEEGLSKIIEECLDPRKHPFVVSSLDKFLEEVVFSGEKTVKLIISPDNHGEIIYLLGLCQELLRINPNLVIYLVPKQNPVADDVDYQKIVDILMMDSGPTGKEYFSDLYQHYQKHSGLPSLEANGKRFFLVADGSYLQGEDLRCWSTAFVRQKGYWDKEGKKELFNRIVYLGIGNANFVSTQGLDMERYYLFRVKADRVSLATGIPQEVSGENLRFPLVLAYVAPGDIIGTTFGRPHDYVTLLEYERAHRDYYTYLENMEHIKQFWRLNYMELVEELLFPSK